MISIFLFLTLNFAQQKILVEEGAPIAKEEPALISSDVLDINLSPNIVSVQGSGQIPEYFAKPLFGKSLRNVLSDRQNLTCQSSTRSSFSCYKCEQQDDRFHYYYFFSDLSGGECALTSYQILLADQQSSEKELRRYMQLHGWQLPEGEVQTPRVYEKPNYQIYLERLGDQLLIRFEGHELDKKLQSMEQNAFYIKNKIEGMWPKYIEITKQYLKEMELTFAEKVEIDDLKDYSVYNDAAFEEAFKALIEQAKEVKNREERACKILQHGDLLSYNVNAELKEKLSDKVTKHWAEHFAKDLRDTVCGNYYYLSKVREYTLDDTKCVERPYQEVKDQLNEMSKWQINQIEKDLIAVFNMAIDSKTKEHSSYINSLVNLKFKDLDSYKNYRKNPKNKDFGLSYCIK